MKPLVLLPLVLWPVAAAAAPDPFDAGGWRFAICRTEAICRLDAQSCIALVGPGQSFIWRDESGLRFGGSARVAVPVSIHATPSEALETLTEDSAGPVLVIPVEQPEADALRVAHFTVTAGVLSNRFDRMRCELRDDIPPEPAPDADLSSPPELLPQPDRPEIPD